MSNETLTKLLNTVSRLEEVCALAAEACDSPASLLRRMESEFTFIKFDLEKLSSEIEPNLNEEKAA